MQLQGARQLDVASEFLGCIVLQVADLLRDGLRQQSAYHWNLTSRRSCNNLMHGSSIMTIHVGQGYPSLAAQHADPL